MTFVPPNPGKYYYTFSDVVLYPDSQNILYPDNQKLLELVNNALLTLQKFGSVVTVSTGVIDQGELSIKCRETDDFMVMRTMNEVFLDVLTIKSMRVNLCKAKKVLHYIDVDDCYLARAVDLILNSQTDYGRVLITFTGNFRGLQSCKEPWSTGEL